MCLGHSGDGSEVRDAEDLALVGNLPHAFANGMGGFAADVGVALVEDQNGDGILGGKYGLQSQHHAGNFAG